MQRTYEKKYANADAKEKKVMIQIQSYHFGASKLMRLSSTLQEEEQILLKKHKKRKKGFYRDYICCG
jgi:3-deoxy-D-manno-octulosonic-acid transferase